MTFVTMLVLSRALAMLPGMFEALNRSGIRRSSMEERARRELEARLDALCARGSGGSVDAGEYREILEEVRGSGKAIEAFVGETENVEDARVMELLGTVFDTILDDDMWFAWWERAARSVVELGAGVRDAYPWVYNPVACALGTLDPGAVQVGDLDDIPAGRVLGVQGFEEQEVYTAWALRLLAPAVRRCATLVEPGGRAEASLLGLLGLCERFEDWTGVEDGEGFPWGAAWEAHDRTRIVLFLVGREALQSSGLLYPLEHGVRIMGEDGRSEYAQRTRRAMLRELAVSLRGSGANIDPLCVIVSTRSERELEHRRLCEFARTAKRLTQRV